MKHFVWREINPERLSRQIPGSLRQFDGLRRIGWWPKDLVWLYSLVKRHWLFATNQFLCIVIISWFNEGNLFLQPYKNLQCPQDFPHSVHIHIPCSPIFPFCLTLTVESQVCSVGSISKNYSQLKKANVSLVLQSLAFSEGRGSHTSYYSRKIWLRTQGLFFLSLQQDCYTRLWLWQSKPGKETKKNFTVAIRSKINIFSCFFLWEGNLHASRKISVKCLGIFMFGSLV